MDPGQDLLHPSQPRFIATRRLWRRFSLLWCRFGLVSTSRGRFVVDLRRGAVLNRFVWSRAGGGVGVWRAGLRFGLVSVVQMTWIRWLLRNSNSTKTIHRYGLLQIRKLTAVYDRHGTCLFLFVYLVFNVIVRRWSGPVPGRRVWRACVVGVVRLGPVSRWMRPGFRLRARGHRLLGGVGGVRGAAVSIGRVRAGRKSRSLTEEWRTR